MISALNEIFSINPMLFFEIVRIKAGLTNCVLPQQIFSSKNAGSLTNLISSYINGLIDIDELVCGMHEIELNVKKGLEGNIIREKLNDLDMDVLPFCTFIDRVLSSKDIPVFPTVQYYVYHLAKEKRTRKKLGMIRKLEIKVLKQNKLKNRMKIIEIEGKLLGYPKCCIQEFLRLKKAISSSSITPEKKIVMELLDSRALKNLPEIFSGLRFDYIYSLFSLNFYPCTIKCKRAIEIGKTCAKHAESFGYRKAYECGLLFNVFYHLVTGYKSYMLLKDRKSKSRYSEKILFHFSNLRQDIEDALNAAKNVITNVKFGNEFIKNCVNFNL